MHPNVRDLQMWKICCLESVGYDECLEQPLRLVFQAWVSGEPKYCSPLLAGRRASPGAAGTLRLETLGFEDHYPFTSTITTYYVTWYKKARKCSFGRVPSLVWPHFWFYIHYRIACMHQEAGDTDGKAVPIRLDKCSGKATPCSRGWKIHSSRWDPLCLHAMERSNRADFRVLIRSKPMHTLSTSNRIYIG